MKDVIAVARHLGADLRALRSALGRWVAQRSKARPGPGATPQQAGPTKTEAARLHRLQAVASESEFERELARLFGSGSGTAAASGGAPGRGPAAPGPARGPAVVVDPHFIPAVESQGHHLNLNLFYRDLLGRLGVGARFYGRRSGEAAPGSQFDFRGLFTVRIHVRLSAGVSPTRLRNVNHYFEHELDAHLPADAPAYVFHSTRHTTLLGLSAWLGRRLDGRSTVVVIGVIDNALGVEGPLGSTVLELYREAFARLRALTGVQVLVCCETGAHADLLRTLAADRVEVRHYAYLAAELAVQHARASRPAPRGTALTLGYVGGTRRERGADLVPGLALASAERLGARARWRVQIDPESYRTMCPPGGEQAIEALAEHARIELVEARLSPAGYYALLESLDILVLPYRERYAVTGSGVFIEALSLGKVMVLPSEGWMLETLNSCGGEAATFRSTGQEEVLQAIETAVRDFGRLRRSMERAAAVWNAQRSPGAQLHAWLAQRLPSAGAPAARVEPAPAGQVTDVPAGRAALASAAWGRADIP